MTIVGYLPFKAKQQKNTMKTMIKEFLCRHMGWLSRLVINREFRIHMQYMWIEDYVDVSARNKWSAIRIAKKFKPKMIVYGLEDSLNDNTQDHTRNEGSEE